jgi:hypothetical protein
MVQSAAHIIQRAPSLEHLKLRYTFPWSSQHEIRLKQVGTYDVAFVLDDDDGGAVQRRPESLLVQEWGLRFTRRGLVSSGLYRYDLRAT